jgi:hypothetical protein
MSLFHPRLAPLLVAGLVCLAASAPAQPPFALLHSLFDPSTNAQAGAQQGYSVAVDGNIAVVGAPFDDVGGQNSGVVKVCDATTGALLHTLTNPSPANFDNFGNSVAVSGTRVVVGALGDDTGAPNAGSAYVYDLASATPAVPLLTLTNPSPATNDIFGYSVAVSGTRVVVGTPDDNTGAPYAGGAYVYDLASGTPTVPAHTLTNPSPANYDYFGYSVAISGMCAVVGTPYDNTGATDAGSAYVYDLASATPTVPVATLTNPSPAGFDRFGFSVAISGPRVVVRALYDETGAIRAGRAYVYDLASATPTVPVATLNSPSPADYDDFGNSVAISGTRVVVGGRGDDTGASDAGRAYVYDLASATPAVPVATLTNPSPTSGDFFGYAVAIAGTRIVVGAIGDDTGASGAGIAYVYDLAGATPTVPVATLTNPSPAVGESFGYSVALSGTRAVVGANQYGVGPAVAGSAYVYDLAGATPAVPVVTLMNPSSALNDNFGNSVAISGTRVIVGTPQDDTGAANTGIVYMYDLTGATPAVPALTLTNPSPAAGDQFGFSVAVSGTRVVVGAYLDDTGAQDAGSVYVYDLVSATPAVPVATLTNPTPALSDWFGSSVALSGTRVVVGTVYDDTGATNAGSAYVYDLASATPTVPVATFNNPSPAVEDRFGFSVAVDGTTIVAGTPRDDTGGLDRGAAYIFGPVPMLSIAPAGFGLATISWTPAMPPGFVLQCSESVTNENWSNAPSGALNPVTIATTNAAKFYRLVQQ